MHLGHDFFCGFFFFNETEVLGNVKLWIVTALKCVEGTCLNLETMNSTDVWKKIVKRHIIYGIINICKKNICSSSVYE